MPDQLVPIAFLPWLNFSKDIRVGRTVFWPYDKMKASMLPSEYPVEQLDKYAHGFRTKNKEIAKVACLSYPMVPNEKLTPKQVSEVQIARYALFACNFISGISDPDDPNLGMRMPSAEHFAIHYLPTLSGIIKNQYYVEYPRMHIMGSASNLQICEPEHLHNCYHSFFEPLRKVIDIAIQRRSFPSRPYVWRSLEWFFHAHTSQEHFTEEARLVILCMAIEAALQEVQGRRDFVQKIGTATAHLRLPKRSRCLKYTNPKGEDGLERGHFNAIEVWASDFYELRKRLVHAKADKSIQIVWKAGRRPIMHFHLASYVWFECLWDALQRSGFVPKPPPEAGDLTLKRARELGRWLGTWEMPVSNVRDEWRKLLNGKDDE